MASPDTLITEINWELTNDSEDFIRPELLVYVNRALELIYSNLVAKRSEFVRTGKDSFATEEGVQSYDLTDETIDITDVWVLHRVWVEGETLMTRCKEKDLYDAINAEENDETGHRCIPQEYCLLGNTLWFKESTDDAYTIQLRYFPKFSAIALHTDMPYNDLANSSIKDMVLMLAKNRIKKNPNLHSQLWTYTQDVTDRIVGLREVKTKKIVVGARCMKCH